MPEGCLVCGEIDGSVAVPGGFLWENELVVAFHIPPIPQNPRPFLGHLLVATRRHVARFGDLTSGEGAAVGTAAVQLAHALTDKAAAEWVYSAVIGRGVPHFHLHLMPRYPRTPKELPWYEEWAEGPHGGADEIAELSRRLRGGLGAEGQI
ncbi:MAG TPA: HIT family protein [Candidatus Dormibacteraeota bacterium]|nr:HIT family protein [Candidatus Dormibacteraeota bacterium]